MANLKWALAVWSLLFGVFAMAPTLPSFSTYKFGPNISGVGSDAYGYMYQIWLHAQPADGKLRSETRDLITNYPEGMALTVIPTINGHLGILFGSLGASPALAYNLVLFLSFALAFAFAYLLALRLGLSLHVSLLAAFTIGLGPYQVLQSVDHIDLASTWVVLLYLICAFEVVVNRKPLWLCGVLLASAGTVYSHPYFFVMTVVLNVFVGVTAAWFWFKGHIRLKKTELGWVAASGALAAAAVLMWKKLFTSVVSDAGFSMNARSMDDLYVYSTKFWDFVLPPHYSWAFSDWTNPFKYRQTAAIGTNLVENTLYPGLFTLLALVGVAVFAAFHIGAAKKYLAHNGRLIWFLAMLTIIPILFSISPTLSFFGITIPTPTYALHQVINEFRTMSRFGYVAASGMVLIAALGLQLAFHRFKWPPLLQKVAVIGLIVVSLLDFGILHSRFYSDSGKVPEVYQAFKQSSDENSLLFEIPYMWGYITWYWQSYHQRRNFGVFVAEAQNHRAIISANRTRLEDWILFSRAQGVTHLIVHSMEPMNIPGAREFRSDPRDTDIFFLFARHSYLLDLRNL